MGFLSFLFYILKKEWELSKNSIEVEGVITKFYKNGQKNFIDYEFYVQKKIYSGRVGVYPFKCHNGVNGCVGHKFTVKYSKNDPDNNDIDLGIYNDFKTRTRIFN